MIIILSLCDYRAPVNYIVLVGSLDKAIDLLFCLLLDIAGKYIELEFEFGHHITVNNFLPDFHSFFLHFTPNCATKIVADLNGQ